MKTYIVKKARDYKFKANRAKENQIDLKKESIKTT